MNDLDTYARQLDLSGKALISTATDHLGSDAKEEVLCFVPLKESEDFMGLTGLLKHRFGSPESVQSLNASFHGRVQKDSVLTEYSRVLIRLYHRIESAADTPDEKDALLQLNEKALGNSSSRGCKMFLPGGNLAMDHSEMFFYDLRELALELLVDEIIYVSMLMNCVQLLKCAAESPKTKPRVMITINC